MSRSAMARNSSHAQTLQQRQRVKSEAESQREMMQVMDDLSRNMALLMEKNSDATQAAREAFEKSARQALDVIHTANAEVTRAATKAHQAAKSTRGLRWTMLLTMFGAGMLVGAVLLAAFLISQPRFILSLWQISEALFPPR